MPVTIELKPASEVGRCQARQCIANQVLLIKTPVGGIVLCEDCLAEITGVADYERKIAAAEERANDAEADTSNAEARIRGLEKEIEQLGEQNKALLKRLKAA